MEKKMDTAGLDGKVQAAPKEPPHVETIASLTAEREELWEEIYSRKDSLERFMLVTGGESDDSDRMQEKIDSLQNTLEEVEGRLQALLDAQEREAFAPEKNRGRHKNTPVRASVKKDLAEKKAEVSMRKPHEKETGRKLPHANMEK